MANLNDKDLLSDIISSSEGLAFQDRLKNEVLEYTEKKQLTGRAKTNLLKNLSYPLDDDTIKALCLLKETGITDKGDNLPFSRAKDLNDLWKMLIEKSIQCLRLFDIREPFKKNPEKTIVAYGIEELDKYYKKYTKFEGLLYGANAKYRDHIFHVFRTWLIGLHVIIKRKFDIEDIDGLKETWESYGKLSTCEKISMWTIIAFCHDLGYPLEKAKDILHVTQDMMQKIVTDSKVSADFSFGGTQTSINEYIVRFISTKMKHHVEQNEAGEQHYNGRIQPKYYFKFTKSLENFAHGIVSAIIIYTMLLYFNESDFNLNDDYRYDGEDARQFYIRREILRAIAAHTCPDIYSVKITTFSSLLYICDEMQNWDRKDWHELYSAQELNTTAVSITTFDETTIAYIEEIKLGEKADIKQFSLDLFKNRYVKYKKKFRDGQYSAQRSFDIKDTVICEKDISGTTKPSVAITINIMGNNTSDKFEIKHVNCNDNEQMTDNDIKDSVFKHEFKKC